MIQSPSPVLSRSLSLRPRHRALATSVAAMLGVALFSSTPRTLAVDGSWTQVAADDQLWSLGTNWTGGTIANAAGGTATFNVDLTADQSIRLEAGRTIGNLVFQDSATGTAGGYNIGSAAAADGPLTLDVTTGRSVINIGGLASGKKVSVFVPIINNDGILKIGAGELSIRADSPGMTGDIVIAGGGTNNTRSLLSNITGLQITNGATFQLDFVNNAGTDVSNLVNSAAPLVLGGSLNIPPTAIPPALPLAFNTAVAGSGTLTFLGKAANNNSQTFSSLTLNAGSHTVNVTAGNSATLNVGAISRLNRSGINFVSTGTTTINTTTANTAGSLLGVWAVVGGNSWAVSAGDGTNAGAITALPAASYANTWADGTHTDVTPSIAAASGNTQTVRFSAAAANTVTLTGPATVTSGGILVSASVGAFASQISGSTLTSGTSELVVFQANTNAAGAATIASNIVDNGAPVGITKLGAGVLTLSGANTLTGTTAVNGGTLNLTGDNTAAAGPFQVNVGTLSVGTGGSTGTLGSGSVTVNPGATLTFNRTDAALVVNANIANSGNLTKVGTGTVTIAGIISGPNAPAPNAGILILTGANTYTGVTNIAGAGTLAVGGNNVLGTGNVRFNAAGATLRAADATARTVPNFIDVANNSVIGAAGTGDLTFTGTFATGNGAKVLTINNTTTTVSGVVTGGPSVNLINKAGPGTLVLANNANTFVRPISIDAGVLQIASETNLGVAPAAFTANHLIFNGGSLRTTASFAIDDANRGITLNATGGTFNPDAGTSLTVASKMTGVGGNLIKAGNGTLNLTGAHDYTGTTSVNAGTLFTTPLQTGATNISVADGATFGVNIATAGTTYSNAGASLTTGVTTGASISIATGLLGNPTAPVISVGAFNPLAPTSIRITGAVTAGVNIPLLDYTSIGGLGFAGLTANLPARTIGTLINNTTDTRVDLTITSVEGIRWQGGATNGDWDIDPTGAGTVGTPNWITTVTTASTRYLQGTGGTDTANFDDNATGTTTVNLTTALSPAGLNITNVNKTYTFAGSGKITGNVTINKQGNGLLVLANTTAYDNTGGLTIAAGSVQVGDGTTNGAGLLPTNGVTNNGTLILNRPDDFAIASTISGSGAIVKNRTNTASFTGGVTYGGPITIADGVLQFNGGGVLSGVVSGTGALTVAGGSLQLAGTTANTYGGLTTVSAGALQLNKTAGSNAVGGNLLVSGGTVTWSQANQVADSASITVNTGALATTNFADTVANVTINSPTLSTISGLNITGTLTVTNGIQDIANSNGTISAGAVILSGSTNVRMGANGAPSTFNIGAGGLTMNTATVQFGQAGAATQTALVTLAGNVTASGTNLFDVNTGNPISRIDLGAATRTFNITSGVTTVEPSFVSATATTGLIKTGNGTLVLEAGTNSNGASTYTGDTTINAGNFIVQGTITGTSRVDVSGTGTLGGRGTITPAAAGNVNLLSGGKLSPGFTGTGTLNFVLNGGSLDISAGVGGANALALAFELDTLINSDTITLTGGALNIGSGVLEFSDFNFTALAGLTGNTDYVLFSGDTPIVGTLGAILSGSIGSFTGQLQLADGNTDLIVHIPEPGTAALLLAASVALSIRRRRRN